MNKILPNQASWLTSSARTRPEQGQNFAEALHGRSDEESKQAKSRSDHVAEAENSTKITSPENGRGTAFAVESEVGEPGRFTKTGDLSALTSGNGDAGGLGPTPDPMLAGADTGALSIGLLAGQVAWSRIYPEHLIASGYLSVVDTSEPGGNVPFEHFAMDGLEIHPQVDTATPVIDGESGVVRVVMTSSPNPLPLPHAGLEDPAISVADAEIGSSLRAMSAITLADHIWAERLIRLTRHNDGEITAWLRDYGLKESDLAPMVSRLIQHGRESGFQIGRVVINGREVWCATRSEGGG